MVENEILQSEKFDKIDEQVNKKLNWILGLSICLSGIYLLGFSLSLIIIIKYVK